VAIVSSASVADSSRAGNVDRHVLCAHNPDRIQLAESAAPSGSSRLLAVFNKFWKHKLINSFNYCLQNINITLQ